MFNNYNILKLSDRIKIANCLLISNYVHNKLPSIFNNWFTFSSCFYQYETPFATKGHFKVPSVKRTSYGKGTITIMVVKTWDDIEKKTKDVLLNSFSPTKLKLFLTLHEKPYFPGPGISWKAPKDQADIIFTSAFCLKKDRISNHRKVQNKDFSVNSKNHLSINFLSQKRPYFPFPKSSKEELFSNQ